jgi:hypothetical protein
MRSQSDVRPTISATSPSVAPRRGSIIRLGYAIFVDDVRSVRAVPTAYGL